ADFFNDIVGPLAYTKPSIETGLVYRLERKRWNLHPGIGVGYSTYLPDRIRKRTRTDQNGTVQEVFYNQDASMLTINAGFSAHYFVTPRGFITLNVHFQQPLQSSSAELSRTSDGVETYRRAHRTAGIGRNATLGVGYGFIFARKGT